MQDTTDFETSKQVNVCDSFDNMNLKEDLLRGLYQYGFEKPSAIQQRAVLPFIQGRDIIAQAQSGTGKSSMIAIALCQLVDTRQREIQALILSPTRELASQTEKVISTIGDYLNVLAHACIGGKSLTDDMRKLENGVHIVSGTPGRVFDMIKRKSLRTRFLKTLVLDEADEMLSQGFKEQIYDVYRYLPPETQVRTSFLCAPPVFAASFLCGPPVCAPSFLCGLLFVRDSFLCCLLLVLVGPAPCVGVLIEAILNMCRRHACAGQQGAGARLRFVLPLVLTRWRVC